MLSFDNIILNELQCIQNAICPQQRSQLSFLDSAPWSMNFLHFKPSEWTVAIVVCCSSVIHPSFSNHQSTTSLTSSSSKFVFTYSFLLKKSPVQIFDIELLKMRKKMLKMLRFESFRVP